MRRFEARRPSARIGLRFLVRLACVVLPTSSPVLIASSTNSPARSAATCTSLPGFWAHQGALPGYLQSSRHRQSPTRSLPSSDSALSDRFGAAGRCHDPGPSDTFCHWDWLLAFFTGLTFHRSALHWCFIAAHAIGTRSGDLAFIFRRSFPT